MSHWAELDKNNKVLRVVVGDNNSPDEGYQWLIDNLGGRWIQTSYNADKGTVGLHNSTSKYMARNRKNYAGIGDTYDDVRDAFIPPQPYKEWVLNEETCKWEAPIKCPDMTKPYIWKDATETNEAGWYMEGYK